MRRRKKSRVSKDTPGIGSRRFARAVKRALTGRSFVAARRIGKQLLLDTNGDGPVLGLHFGMAGRLLVDGRAAITDLWWASNRELEKWDRFAIDGCPICSWPPDRAR